MTTPHLSRARFLEHWMSVGMDFYNRGMIDLENYALYPKDEIEALHSRIAQLENRIAHFSRQLLAYKMNDDFDDFTFDWGGLDGPKPN